jgi:ankyrin repeat protein
MNIVYYRKAFLMVLIPLSFIALGMEMNLDPIPKSKNEPNILTFTLEDHGYSFPIEPILKHITRYQKGIDSAGQDKLLGFHHYKPASRKELSACITLSVVQDNLWVLGFGDITTFHKGYVIYQGKAFPKTFFPTSWNKDGISTYLTYLLSSSKHLVKIKNHPDGLTKTYGVTLTDTNGQALSCIIHGCPLIPQSMHLVTVYPALAAQPEPENLSLTLKTLAYEQLQKLQATTKVHTPNPELITALEKKDSERVQQLLASGSDPDVHDSKGKTALMYAATTEDWTLVNTLLEYGADLLAHDTNGNTALHYATASKDYFTLLGIISPRLIDKANSRGITPLLSALMHKNIDAIELLLQFKAHPSLADTFNQTPLMLAIKAYHTKADLPFCKTAITLLLQAGTAVDTQDKQGNTALHYAIESGSLELVESLLNAHVCSTLTNTKKDTPLALAKKRNYTDIVALFEKAEKNKLEWIKENQGTELMYAVKTGNIRKVKELLTQKINVNAQDSYGWTALIYAVEANNAQLVTLLLEAGADPRVQVSPSCSLLSYAHNQNAICIADILEKKRAELDAPLLEQKQKEYSQLKEALKRFKADSERGQLSEETLAALPLFKNRILNPESRITPLLYAVKEKKHQIIEQLLERGADIAARDSEGSDALTLAYKHNDLAALTLLLRLSSQSHLIEIFYKALTDNNTAIIKLLHAHDNSLVYQSLVKALNDNSKLLASKLIAQELTTPQAGQALIIALLKGNSEAARLIIKTHPQAVTYKDSTSMTPLMHSVRHNFLELVKLLVEAGADIYAVDSAGKVARNYTSSKSSLYHYLLAQEKSYEQAHKQAQDKEAKERFKRELEQQGWPALAIAVSIGNSTGIEEYQGDNLNAVTPEGSTPLLIAAKNNNENLVSLLLTKSGINVNARDKEGNTALMYAALNNNETLVATLLKHGAHPSIANNKKITAFDLIKTKKGLSTSIKALLKKAQDTVIGAYCDGIKHKDQEKLKELQAALALPIALPASYLTPQVWIDVLNLIDKAHDKAALLQPLINAIDDTQAMQDSMGKALISLIDQEDGKKSSRIKLLLSLGANINAKDSNNKTALTCAAMKKNAKAVKLLLKANADSNVQDSLGSTPLFYAAENEDIEVVKLLLAHPNINSNVKNNEGTSVLMAAVHTRTRNLELVKILLNRGADPNAQDSDGDTPLLCTASGCCAGGENAVEVAQLLLSNKAHVNIKNNDGDTPLLNAAAEGRYKMVKLLVANGANVNAQNNEGATPLMYAAGAGDIEITKLLLDADADITIKDTQGTTALICAVTDEHPEIVKLLLTHPNINVNIKDNQDRTALMHAAGMAYTEIVKLLLDAHATVTAMDIYGQTALMAAVDPGNITIVELLLNAGANIETKDEQGQTALMLAADKGHSNLVQLLLTRGAKADVQEDHGHPALLHAVAKGHTETAKILLDALAGNKNLPFIIHMALLSASEKGYSQIVKLLLSAGANVNIQDKNGITPLIYAVNQGNEEVVKLLLSASPDINKATPRGVTPLMFAAHNGYPKIINLLLEANANFNKKDKRGDNALAYAKEGGFDEIVGLLMMARNLKSFMDTNSSTHA